LTALALTILAYTLLAYPACILLGYPIIFTLTHVSSDQGAMTKQAPMMEPNIASTLKAWADADIVLVFPGCKDFTFKVQLELIAGDRLSIEDARR
jgi:hypothetical protein